MKNIKSIPSLFCIRAIIFAIFTLFYASSAHCSPLSFTPASGFYSSMVEVKISIKDPQAVIYYSTDGSAPTMSSHIYNGAIQVNSTTVLRAVGFKNDKATSPVNTGTYFIGEKTSLPVVSIGVDPKSMFDPVKGMYMMGPDASKEKPYYGANFWKKMELPINVELFEPGGAAGFTSGAGMKIAGNFSRQFPKKSLSIYFKKKYGTSKLKYPLFPDFPKVTKFKVFILRNNGNNYGRAMMRDGLASSLTKGLEVDYQKFRPCVVFINGKYWGLYNIREKSTARYFKSNYNVKKKNLDLIKKMAIVQAGDAAAYNNLTGYLETNDMRKERHYKHISNMMDIDNFIDYNLLELYIVNTDWPGNNNKRWRERKPGAKWRWFIFDCDAGFEAWQQDLAKDMITFATDPDGPGYPNPPWSTLVLRKLLKNKDFRNRFISRAATHLNTRFSKTGVHKRIDEIAAMIYDEIPRDYDRWNYKDEWEDEVDILKGFASERADYMFLNFARYFKTNGTAKLKIEGTGGRVFIDGLDTGKSRYSGKYFKGTRLTLKAIPYRGKKFLKWSDGIAQAERVIDITGDVGYTPIFQ